MQNEWLLDVLSDLKSFAAANGLPKLTAQLDQTRAVAVIEMSSCQMVANGMMRTDEKRAESDSRTGSTRLRA